MQERLAEDSVSKDSPFCGAVLVAQHNKPIFEHAYGLADREKKIPNQLGTKFRIGSMNKMFTAVAIAQLAQSGKLQFSDSLGKYLPDYPNPEVAHKVTIHQLLTHTGGTGDFFGPEFDAHRRELQDLKDYVTLFGPRGLAFDPGSQYAYSNYGFLLLGLVIERVTGQSYYNYVRQQIFERAGMTSTDSLPEGTPVPKLSLGYTNKLGPGLRPNTDTLPSRGTSAGGGYSTVGDLLRFANALLSHQLLDAHDTEVVTTGKVTVGPAFWNPNKLSASFTNYAMYAYGFEDTASDGVRWLGHNGGAPGMNGSLRIYPASGYVVVILANVDPPAADVIADFIGDRLPPE